MWEFLKSGGPVMFLLVLTSLVGLAYIIERGRALRWHKVIPPEIETALENCRAETDLAALQQVCQRFPSPIGRLLLFASNHLHWPKEENTDTIQTRARHEIVQLERGLVILEIVVGIAPLLGLAGAIDGLIKLFGDVGQAGFGNNAALASGIAIVLHTTLAGLLIAIPALIAWSYYTRKVETLSVEMETLCDEFLRRFYRSKRR